MNIYFPQWQGAGKDNQLEAGAKLLFEYWSEYSFEKIPLSEGPLIREDNINGLRVLEEQLSAFRSFLYSLQPKHLFTLGGDCGLEIIPVSYLNQQYDHQLAVVWFDAHADLNTPEDSPSKNFHGMPLRTMLGMGNERLRRLLFSRLRADQIYYVGLRDIDPPEKQYMNEEGIFLQQEPSPEKLVTELANRGYQYIYLHLDLDILDPSAFKYTHYQVSEGWMLEELRDTYKSLLKHFEVVGGSILESVATSFDQLEVLKPLLIEVENIMIKD